VINGLPGNCNGNTPALVYGDEASTGNTPGLEQIQTEAPREKSSRGRRAVPVLQAL
jgi:hypothetical protein